jgi:putative addiction module component (TIGR02574 family)
LVARYTSCRSSFARATLKGLLALDIENRLTLAQELWDSIVEEAQSGTELPIAEVERRELDDRLREDDQDPEGAISWPEAVEPRREPALGDQRAHSFRVDHQAARPLRCRPADHNSHAPCGVSCLLTRSRGLLAPGTSGAEVADPGVRRWAHGFDLRGRHQRQGGGQ